ncbi:MAG: Beta-barrel assembly-enhancing protease [Verrucomicrobiae bacterium]|nr:Beta-barrel assembly-enhancing protease [Verrucomicrobiae bacterium]
MAKQPENSNPITAPASVAAARGLFTWQEWVAAGLAFLVSGLTYLYYMTPEVTLQDSGELVTGAFNFGVPHPTGYPFWAFLGWIWCQIVPFGNPAWRVGLMSVVTGAALVGILTLLMSRSILMLLRNSPWDDKIDESMKEWLSLSTATASALLFAFNRGVWLWACVPEMRVLNVFSFILTTCLFFAWMMQPDKPRYLYATLLVLGLSMANHQTIVVMALPLVVGAVAVGLVSDRKGERPQLAGLCELTFALLVSWVVVVTANAWLLAGPTESLFQQEVKLLFLAGPKTAPLPVMLLAGGGAIALLLFGTQAGWLSWKRALWCAAMLLLGISFYIYMPIASATNPPMNWGFASTKQGFLHSITRGQYEQLRMGSPLSKDFYLQIWLFMSAVFHQYSLPVSIFAAVPFVVAFKFWKQIKARGRQWLIFMAVAFFTTCVGLMMILNPGLDKTQQEINLKFFAPAHGFFAILIGYGLAFTLAWIVTRWAELPKIVVRIGCWSLVLLAFIPFTRNWATCEQRGHDFGYQFGYRMFNPGGDYPPMDRDAFLFGGTDPGRFVPTYMIFCESQVEPRNKFRDPNFDRRDVYIVTQNALADTTYMAYIRDHYDYSRPNPTNEATLAKYAPWQRRVFKWGWHALNRDTMYPVEPLWIPAEQDSQRAFQEYVADVQARRARGEQPDPEEEVDIVGGRVQVRGVKGVMNINGILCKWIHDRNKQKHSFYIEESYVIPWMYPYLEPYGIIMKINKDMLPTPQENPLLWSQMIERDKKYWNQLVAEFTARPEFWRDNDARKTFSKLRSAIGGIYSFRKLHNEAEYAFRQSLQLCPDSPEANFRFAQLLIETGKPEEAVRTLEEYQKLDPFNAKIGMAVQQIRNIQQAGISLQNLEQQFAVQPRNLTNVAQLAQAYLRLNQFDRIPPLFDRFLNQPGIPAGDMLQIAQFYLSLNQAAPAIRTLEHGISIHPQDTEMHYALALVRGMTGDPANALAALTKAIQIDPNIRARARGDQRFNALRTDPRFQTLVNAP